MPLWLPPHTGVSDLIDLEIGKAVVEMDQVGDNRGYARPEFNLTATDEPFFTRELHDMYGRAREYVDSFTQ